MDISQNRLNFIQQAEGCKLEAYQDSAGIWTIGVGHTGPDVHQGLIITSEQAIALLHQDVQKAVTAINRFVTQPLNQNQFDALVSFTYNVGIGAFCSSTLLKYINENRMSLAAGEFGKWCHAGGKVLPGLVARRMKERDLFCAPNE